MSYLQKLIFEGILPPEVLDKLGNVDELDDRNFEDESMEESSQHFGRQRTPKNRGQRQRRTQSEADSDANRSVEGESRSRSVGTGQEDEDEKFIDDFSVSSESKEDEEEKKYSQQLDESQAMSETGIQQSRNPLEKEGKVRKGKVKFQETSQEDKISSQAYKAIDLSVLYKTKNEIIFKLTEIYLPSTKSQRNKMIEYNRNQMMTINDVENEPMRARKRRIKEELKLAKGKLKHQIKYCNPGPLLDDAYYLYTPGLTSRQLDLMRDRNKYSHAPHIGKIIPQKRHINMQQVVDQQRMMQQQSLEAKQQRQEQQVKSYLEEDKFGLQKISLTSEIMDSQQVTMQEEETNKFKRLEAQYFQVSQKLGNEDFKLSGYLKPINNDKDADCVFTDVSTSKNSTFTELEPEARAIIKKYLHIQASVVVDSKYPQIKLLNLEKQCYTFMRNLNIDDFSYKGQKSQIQSDDTGMFFEELYGTQGANHSHNSLPIFGIAHTTGTDERLSLGSDNTFGKDRDNSKNKKNDSSSMPNSSMQELFIEQKYKIMEQNEGHQIKRKRYWGEPLDCSSTKQVQKDNFIYKQFQNRQYLQRGGKDEKVFKVERIMPQQQSHSRGKKNNDVENIKAEQEALKNSNQQIKDIKEYEYLKDQEKYFYADDNEKKLNVNAIMRGLKLSLGMISQEEFYAQEELEDLLDQSTVASLSHLSGVSKQSQLKDRSSTGRPLTSQVVSATLAQKRKEQVLADFVDNFDLHFDRRKKELHESLLKKIQQHEKAVQQTSGTGTGQPQTVAYASGSHALLQATAGMDSSKGQDGNRGKIKDMVNMSKLSEDQEYGINMSDHNIHANQDEDMPMEDQNQPSSSTKLHHEGLMAADYPSSRVTKSMSNQINHAKCILKLTFTRFDWSEKALMNFHRPDINEVFDMLQLEQERTLQTQMQANNGGGSSGTYVFSQGQLRLENRYNQDVAIQDLKNQNVDCINMPLIVLTNEQIERRAKKVGIINAHEYFKDRIKLSLKEGKYCVFEHIDQQPLFVNDFGMASKLKRYVYSDKPLPPSAFLKRSENQGLRHMGPHGAQFLKKKGEKIPLLGQIDTKQYKGLTVLENNMYYCPVFYHKPQRNDFFCVLHKDKNFQPQIVVRDLSEIYIMGQEEPKVEVYNPQSRQYQHFIKRRTQAYVIRFLQESNNYISFQELNKYFPYINDQILKKIIKEINVEVDRNQFCSLSQEYNDEQFRQLITPENICQYESAQYGEQMLKKVGIRDITNADKIQFATNKFCSEEPNQKKQWIARIIEEEVLSTPWNLSQNFIHNRQTKGMMMLVGIGDPSHGHGGYSYLKLPLKISQDSLNSAKINRMYLNPAIQNPKAVTGTDADLRKLSKKEIKNKLIDLGFKEESIASFTRWEMVALLRDKSSQAVSQGMEGEMKKFARGVRFTSKKQREMHQKQINDIFKKQMNYLSRESGDFLQDYSDTEGRDQRQKKTSEIQQTNNSNYGKNIVELKDDIEVKNIKDIPNYEILIMANQAARSAPAAAISASGTGSLNIGSNSGLGGGGQTGYDPNTGLIDRDAAALALKQRLQEGMTLKCTILRKKIKAVNTQASDKDKIERVIFCSDPRQIKGFNKRKHKHEVKTKRTKKTSLKEKMQTSKPIMDDFKDRGANYARSETSSVIIRQQQMGSSQPISIPTQALTLGGDSTKIKIGVPTQDPYLKQQLQPQPLHLQHSSSNLAISLPNIVPSKKPKHHQSQSTFQRFSSSIQLSNKPFDELLENQQLQSFDMDNNKQFSSGNLNMPSLFSKQPQQQLQEPGKIAIRFSGFAKESFFEKDVSSQREKPKQSKEEIESNYPNNKKKQQQKPKQQVQSKFASTTYNDEDYESYKPKNQGTSSRRRQQSGAALLNEHFSNVLESAIALDKQRIFHQQVKKKEAPLYYDRIKKPIALTDMKNKAKRQEYETQEEFLQDFALMRSNAETYNGPQHPISQLGRDLEENALNKLKEIEQDVINLELLVQEQKANKLII